MHLIPASHIVGEDLVGGLYWAQTTSACISIWKIIVMSTRIIAIIPVLSNIIMYLYLAYSLRDGREGDDMLFSMEAREDWNSMHCIAYIVAASDTQVTCMSVRRTRRPSTSCTAMHSYNGQRDVLHLEQIAKQNHTVHAHLWVLADKSYCPLLKCRIYWPIPQSCYELCEWQPRWTTVAIKVFIHTLAPCAWSQHLTSKVST